MTEAVLDASVVLKWFRTEGERNLAAARELRRAYERGRLGVVVPPLLRLEIVNVAGRRWGWDETALVELAHGLDGIGFEYRDASLDAIAGWTAQGLTAYDAAYVALAEVEAVPLVTDDDLILSAAPSVATPLAGAAQTM